MNKTQAQKKAINTMLSLGSHPEDWGYGRGLFVPKNPLMGGIDTTYSSSTIPQQYVQQYVQQNPVKMMPQPIQVRQQFVQPVSTFPQQRLQQAYTNLTQQQPIQTQLQQIPLQPYSNVIQAPQQKFDSQFIQPQPTTVRQPQPTTTTPMNQMGSQLQKIQAQANQIQAMINMMRKK